MKKMFAPLVMLGALIAVGCTAQAPSTRETATTVEPSRPSSSDTVKAAESTADEKRKAEARAAAIEYIREVFNPNADDTWKTALRGGLDTKACAMRDQMIRLNAAFREADAAEPKISIAEVTSIDPNTLWRKYQDAGKTYAAELLKTFSMTLQQREQMGACGAGEGSLGFTDTGRLGEEIERTLEQTKLNPTAVGTTGEKLRSLLLSDYKARLAKLREPLKGKELLSTDDAETFSFVYVAEQAMDNWNFTAAQLGLTAKETEFIKNRPRG